MNLFDVYHRTVPEYYPYMYLDGFTPEQIMYAQRKKMIKEYQERNNTGNNIKIESEIKIK